MGGPASPGKRTPWYLGSWGHSLFRALALANCLSDGVMGSWHSWVHSSGLPLLWTGYPLASFLCFSEGDKSYIRVHKRRTDIACMSMPLSSGNKGTVFMFNSIFIKQLVAKTSIAEKTLPVATAN